MTLLPTASYDSVSIQEAYNRAIWEARDDQSRRLRLREARDILLGVEQVHSEQVQVHSEQVQPVRSSARDIRDAAEVAVRLFRSIRRAFTP